MRLLAVALAVVLPWPKAAFATLVAVPPPNLGARCDDLDPIALAEAIERELPAMQKMSASIDFAGRPVPFAEYARKTLAPLAALARQGTEALCAALPAKFTFYRNPDAGAGKFTAYHNPIIRASRQKQGVYQFPLYRRPKGPLAALTTAQIIAGGLAGQNLELLYLADPTELNAVHVEGSATVILDDNTTIAIGSDGHNGHPYQNVSKALAADNKIPKAQVTPIGMTRARKYFQEHPDDLWVYWGKNPHYVFFKEKAVPGGQAASGRFGALTAGRSLAVDPTHVPLGAAVWFRTDMPAIKDNKVGSWVSYGRVALGQDTGAGIKGAGRVDVFFGTGEYAQQASAVTTRPGEIYILLAK
ncbi:MAG: hypothetical protein EXR72_07580 [Myxococcales bacterium]|nr:hypothetical protein [Myxococcales bacterium]